MARGFLRGRTGWRIASFLCAGTLPFAGCVQPRPPVDTTGQSLVADPLVDIAQFDPRIIVDVRYATADNFMGQAVYPVNRCMVRRSVAERLRRVEDRLEKMGLGLKIHDGYRPLAVQRRMWAIMPNPDYVADPANGSRHNRGAAVDVTLVDGDGRELEMPTPYDAFTPAARRDFAGGSEAARRNRDLLTEVMSEQGFVGLVTEWWHFDAPNWRELPLLDVPLDDR